MRKYLFTAIALLMGLTVHAQDGKSFYDTFEDGTANGWKAFAYQEGGPTTSHVSVVDNPLVAGQTTAAKCSSYRKTTWPTLMVLSKKVLS